MSQRRDHRSPESDKSSCKIHLTLDLTAFALCFAALSIATPFDSVYAGLHNYNCALACVAIGGMFYALTWQTHLLSLACGMYLLCMHKKNLYAARQSVSSTGLESTTTLLQN